MGGNEHGPPGLQMAQLFFSGKNLLGLKDPVDFTTQKKFKRRGPKNPPPPYFSVKYFLKTLLPLKKKTNLEPFLGKEIFQKGKFWFKLVFFQNPRLT